MYKTWDNKGLTLLEVLFALLLLSLMAVSGLGLFLTANLWINQGRQQTIASCYASSILEELRSKGQLESGQKQYLAADSEELNSDSLQNMQAILSINKRVDIEHLYDVSVELSWQEGSNSRSLILKTIMRSGSDKGD